MIIRQTWNSVHLPQNTKKPAVSRKTRCSRLEARFLIFSSERVSDFSLKSRAIRPSDSFGPRSKAVLRSEGFAWVPILGSFDKLHEVGVLSYLSYTLFKCFVDY